MPDKSQMLLTNLRINSCMFFTILGFCKMCYSASKPWRHKDWFQHIILVNAKGLGITRFEARLMRRDNGLLNKYLELRQALFLNSDLSLILNIDKLFTFMSIHFSFSISNLAMCTHDFELALIPSLSFDAGLTAVLPCLLGFSVY